MKPPKELKDMAELMVVAIMGVINRNRYSYRQDISKEFDAHISTTIEFKSVKEIVTHIRSWLHTNNAVYNVVSIEYFDDNNTTMLIFNINNEKWRVPLIINEHTEGSVSKEHYHEITVWINTFVAKRI